MICEKFALEKLNWLKFLPLQLPAIWYKILQNLSNSPKMAFASAHSNYNFSCIDYTAVRASDNL